jgi:hypothetical protein
MDASKIADFLRNLVRADFLNSPVDAVSPGSDDGGPDVSSFTLTKDDWNPKPGGSGRGRTKGQWTYTVTVHRTYVPADDED